jgi:hypothetical protein
MSDQSDPIEYDTTDTPDPYPVEDPATQVLADDSILYPGTY